MMNNKSRYNTINSEETLVIPDTWINYCSKILHVYVIPLFCGIFILLGALLSIYIIIIVLGLLVVSVNFLFENTMVYIIGRGSYNKNFPICSDRIYSGNNCYTTRSTYCS
jgi:hypothetical protein